MEGVVKWCDYALVAADYVSVACEELDEQELLFGVRLSFVIVFFHSF